MRDLAYLLPDIPRWVETRAMLLSGYCEVSSVAGLQFVARNTLTGLLSVVGRPPREPLIAIAETSSEDILVQQENLEYVREALPFFQVEEAILHTQRLSAPGPPEGVVRFVTADELIALPNELRQELLLGLKVSPVAAVFVEGNPVSFCYAGAETETLWDVSIDTLEKFRGRGYAIACVQFMIAFMAERGKAPVWGAEVSNHASLRLAAKLGFQPVDRLYVLRQPVT